MKMSEALREVARLYEENPKHRAFRGGFYVAVAEVSQSLSLSAMVVMEVCEVFGFLITEILITEIEDGDWTVRSWMCLFLAEYLEESDR